MRFKAEPPPVPESQLAECERRLAEVGHRIPPSYKAFLAERDGGRPVENSFAFTQEDRENESLVQNFLGLGPVPPPDVNLLDTVGLLGDRLPTGVLPIANDPVGNLVCIDTRDGRDGPVLFWDHEREDEPPSDANLYYVAPDLQTFLDSLVEDEPLPPLEPRPSLWKRLFGRSP